MSDSYVSNSYNAETDGKMSQDTATYTNKDGNTVYTVANYKELEAEALKIEEDLIKNNPLGITTAILELDIANREKHTFPPSLNVATFKLPKSFAPPPDEIVT